LWFNVAMFLGIDYGQKNIGLAISDESSGLAFPLEVINTKNSPAEHIAKICLEKDIKKIIIGESKNLDGKPNPIMSKIREFGEKLKKRTGLPVYFEPEFLTTKQASQIQGRHKNIDASAAAIILQSFLDRKNNKS